MLFSQAATESKKSQELKEEKIKRKQSEETMKNMNTDLKYQEKEIFFLRDENIKAKQEIDNYRNYIQELIIQNGIQVDYQTAEIMHLDL